METQDIRITSDSRVLYEVRVLEMGENMEEIWNFGYRGEVSHFAYYWYGTVYAPRWHPVRAEGMHNFMGLMIKGEWNMVEVFDTRQEAVEWVFKTACLLNVMQDNWDSLSPYEREYLV